MGVTENIRVGTRGSLLARTQTQHVLDAIARLRPDVRFETVIIRTRGDVHTGRLPTDVGKGFFTKEIEDALLAGEVDFAIHSLKDLPAEMPDGLTIGAIPAREDPGDALVGITRAELGNPDMSPSVGTCSLRRAAQLRRTFPHCRIVDLRGNIDTRLRKIREGTLDAGILALAGLRRVGMDGEASHVFGPEEMMPAPGQGALGIECRADDARTVELIGAVHCSGTAARVAAERAFMHSLGGGCQVPVAALAVIVGDVLDLGGRVISVDGGELVEGRRSGRVERAAEIGREMAAEMMERGAGRILNEVCRTVEAGEGQ